MVNDQVSTWISRIVSKSNRYVLGCVHRHPISVAFSAHHRYLVFVGQRLRPSLLRPRTLVFGTQRLRTSFSAHHRYPRLCWPTSPPIATPPSYPRLHRPTSPCYDSTPFVQFFFIFLILVSSYELCAARLRIASCFYCAFDSCLTSSFYTRSIPNDSLALASRIYAPKSAVPYYINRSSCSLVL